MKCMATPLALLLFLCSSFSFAQYDPSENKNIYFENSIIKSTEESQNHKTLLAAVKAAELDKTLNSDGPFTVFAPSDMAFKKMLPEKIAELLQPENKKELQSVLTYHIVAGNLTAAKILKAMCRGRGTASFTTVQGNEITATMDGIDIVLTDCF